MSSVAKMAPAEIAVSIPPCILIIDDDEKFLEGARDFFSSCGFNVDTALTPEKAKQILKENENKYQLVATDVNFGDLSETKGDQFVLQNRSLFGKAKKVIISGGEWLTQERREQLQRAGISSLEKTGTLNERLAAITREENEKRVNDIERVVKKKMGARIEKLTGGPVDIKIMSGSSPQLKRPLSELAVDRLKQTLIKWLKSRGELDEPVLAYGKHVYSANDMIKHIEDETEVGLEHVRMLLGEFEYSLEIDEDASQQYDEEYAE